MCRDKRCRVYFLNDIFHVSDFQPCDHAVENRLLKVTDTFTAHPSAAFINRHPSMQPAYDGFFYIFAFRRDDGIRRILLDSVNYEVNCFGGGPIRQNRIQSRLDSEKESRS